MENEKLVRKLRAIREIGRVFVNFGNLTFASLVLGTIIKGDYDRFLLLLIGGAFALVFIAIGVLMLTKSGGEK